MGQSSLPFDLQRDATKYKNLVRALDQAAHEIRAMEVAEIFDIDELLIRLLPNIAEALDAEQAFVAREEHDFGEHGQEPHQHHHQLFVLAHFPFEYQPHGFPLSAEGLLRDVLENGAPRVKTSLGLHGSSFVAGLELFNARSAVVVRMQTQAATYLVGVCNERHPEKAPFLAADRMTLSYIVEMAAINARASERRQQELDAIREIAECSANRSTQEIYAVIEHWAVQVTGARYATIWQYRTSTSTLHFQHAHHSQISNWQPRQIMQPITPAQVSALVASPQGRLYLRHGDENLADFPWEKEMAAIFVVPLLIEQRLLGLLYVANDELDGFSLDDQRFIDHLAPHAAVALHTARQKENRERVIRFQQTVSDVRPLEEQLKQIRDELHRYVDTSGLFIALLNGRRQEIYFPLAYHRNQQAAWMDEVYDQRYSPTPLGKRYGMVEWIFRRRESLLVSHFESWPERHRFQSESQSDLRSCLVVPLISKGDVVGAIGLRSHDPTLRFDEYDKRFVETLANHLATIIYNSQLYDQRVKEVQAVSRFQEKISGLSETVEEEVKEIYEEASTVLHSVGINTENMIVALYRPESRRLEFKLVYDGGNRLTDEECEEHPAFRTRTVGEDDGDIYAWMLKTRETLLGRTKDEIASWRGRLHGVQTVPNQSLSWLGAPMIANDELVGLIILRHLSEENAFQPNHRELLKTIAAQAAIMIRNIAQADRLSRSNAVAIMGAWGADIVHDINREVGSIRRAVYMLKHQKSVTEREQAYLQRIDESMGRLALPELPEGVPDPATRLDVRRAPSLQRVLQNEFTILKEQSPGIDLLWKFNGEDDKVAMHEQWLRRMVRHLVKNGIKAVQTEGILEQRVTIDVTTTAADALIRVTDTGKGVRPEIRPSLFRRYIRHDKERAMERPGRGLLLVGYIMEAHGGRAELEWSEIGRGSCFLLAIPLIAEHRSINGYDGGRQTIDD